MRRTSTQARCGGGCMWPRALPFHRPFRRSPLALSPQFPSPPAAPSREVTSHHVELVESRRLLSEAPFTPNLVSAGHTGLSNADNVTRFDNATPAAGLQFLVS